MKHGDDNSSGRRRFLAGLTAIGGLAAAGNALSDNSEPRHHDETPTADQDPVSASSGYRETEHVQAYYRSLRD